MTLLFGLICFALGIYISWRYKDSFLNWIKEVF
jgi:hypothetical protein